MAQRSQTGSDALSLIRQFALKYGVDPAAALAVASGEGGVGYGAVGDNGTSFGPFQLHIGGALPAEYAGSAQAASTFANSPAGIDYALRKMGEVAAGLTGNAAIETIIRRFERPANPEASIAKATGRSLASYSAPAAPAAPVAPAVPAPLVVAATQPTGPYQQPLPFPRLATSSPGGTMPTKTVKPRTPANVGTVAQLLAGIRPNDRAGALGVNGTAPTAPAVAGPKVGLSGGFDFSNTPPVRTPQASTAPATTAQTLTQDEINKQAHDLVAAQLAPILQQIQDAYTGRSKAAQDAINGYTTTFADRLAALGGDVSNTYNEAQTQQNAVDNALMQRLTGQGSDLAGSLSQVLANAHQATAPADALAGYGASAANTGYALGSASLSQLLAQGANAKTYADKLPGLGVLQGAQATSSIQGDLARKAAEEAAAVSAKAPGLEQTLAGQIASSQEKRYTADTAAAAKVTAAQAAAATAAAKAKQAQDNADRTFKETKRRFDAGQATAKEVANARVKAENAKAKATFTANANKIDPARSAALRYEVDMNGNQMKDAKGAVIPYTPYVKPATPKAPATVSPTFTAGQAAAHQVVDAASSTKHNDGYAYNKFNERVGGSWPKTAPKTPAATGKLTPTSLAKYGGIAATIAENAFNGFSTTDKNGVVTQHPPIDYQTALNEMGKAGILSLPGGEKLAKYWLSKHYPAGIRGAPGGKKPLAGAVPIGPLDALAAGRGSGVSMKPVPVRPPTGVLGVAK